MQKWEYLFVTLDYAGSEMKPHFINGKEVADWKNAVNFTGSLPVWGNEGWELINLVVTKTDGSTFNEADRYRAIFKRPKE